MHAALIAAALSAGASPPTPLGAPVLVALASAENATTTTLTLSVTTTIPAGSAVYVGQCVSTGMTLNPVTDSKSNTWTAITATAGTVRFGGGWSILTTPLVSGDTITVSFATTSGRKFGWAYVLPGVVGFDQVGAGTSGTDANPTITTGALAQANEILLFATYGGAMNDASWTEDTNSTKLDDIKILTGPADARRVVTSYRIVAATTPVVYDPELSASQTWAQNYTAFKGS